MQIRGADFVVYEVSDLDRSVEFYGQVLQLPLTERIDDFGWAEFDVPPTTLALLDPSRMRPQDPAPKTGGAAIYLAVSDVPATVAELRAKGVIVALEPFETPACWIAGVLDPDGNFIGLHQRKDGTFG